MAKVSKRLKALRSSVEANKLYSNRRSNLLWLKKLLLLNLTSLLNVSFNLGC